MLKIVLIVIAVWLAGHFIYSRIVAYRYHRWERKIERTVSGVRAGHEPFSVGETGDTAILMIHGFADTPKSWRPMATVLAKRGFTCRVMRLEGFAEPLAALEDVTIDDWLGAIDSEARILEQEYANVWIVGHSTGAALAIRHVLDHPGRHPGLVVMAPLLDVSDARSPLISARGWFAMMDHMMLFTDTVENVLPPDLRSTAMVAGELESRDRFFPASVYRNLYSLADSLKGRGSELTCPVLLILAENDHVIDIEQARTFIGDSTCAHSEVLLTNSFHVIHVDSDWREATRATAEFIKAQSAR